MKPRRCYHLPFPLVDAVSVLRWQGQWRGRFAKENRRCKIFVCLRLVAALNVSLYHDCFGKQVAVVEGGIEAPCLMSCWVALESTICNSRVRIADIISFPIRDM